MRVVLVDGVGFGFGKILQRVQIDLLVNVFQGHIYGFVVDTFAAQLVCYFYASPFLQIYLRVAVDAAVSFLVDEVVVDQVFHDTFRKIFVGTPCAELVSDCRTALFIGGAVLLCF